ncbi:unnamed protein product [Hydatigera taeniaeformis]|uniref:Uncharacterized protein n=1 Tax=Hydatigena taeniaeformis TaxID=6205 RepID=A0A3P7GIG3_HYDTA|nr:unnamed protein product [Hydatigera taeniaeformis]
MRRSACICGRVVDPPRTSILPKVVGSSEQMEQIINPRHESSVLHRRFDPDTDANLYIDLENLPPNTPMMSFEDTYDFEVDGGIEIPLFIAGPMKVLLCLVEDSVFDNSDDFMDDLGYRLIYDPTPYEPECDVCCLVEWLLTECHNYAECLTELFGLEQIRIFEIMREIWCRLRPKPVAFSGLHVQFSREINYLTIPLSNIYNLPLFPYLGHFPLPWEERRDSSLEWTYGFMSLVHDDIVNAGRRGPVSCFLFINIMRILRAYIANVLPSVDAGTNPSLYVLNAIREDQEIVLSAIMKLSKALFLTIAELEGDWLPEDSPPPPGFRKEESLWYRLSIRRIVENLLTMNFAELFFNSTTPKDLYMQKVTWTVIIDPLTTGDPNSRDGGSISVRVDAPLNGVGVMNCGVSDCFRHFCGLPHRIFNPQCDDHLYIDLECMNPETRMERFDDKYKFCAVEGALIPVFIAGPLIVLRMRYECNQNVDRSRRFFECLDYTSVCDPTPENPQCLVCCWVRWLLTQCCALQDCIDHFRNLEEIIVFEVMREILLRLKPKPLFISPRHLHFAKLFNYIGLPLRSFLHTPALPHCIIPCSNWCDRLLGSLEWTNGFMYLLYKDLGDQGIRSHVARFVFVNLIRILRRHSESAFPPQPDINFPQYYMLEAVQCNQEEALRPIMKFAKALYLALLEYEPYGFVCDTPPIPGCRREEVYVYQHNLLRVMENIFMMNVTDVFYNNADLNSIIVHNLEVHGTPNECMCRFAQSLQQEDC